MKIKTSFPVETMRGTPKGSGLTFFVLKAQQLARAFVTPFNPQSAEQIAIRSFINSASNAWENLSQANQNAWAAYATSISYPNSGQSLFVQCTVRRQIGTLAIVDTAPAVTPPVGPSNCSVEDDGTNLYIRLTHGQGSPANYRAYIRLTNKMLTPARHPNRQQLRYAAGLTSASTPTLVASGNTMAIPKIDLRFALEFGDRIGVEATIVHTASGIASPYYFSETTITES